MDEKSIIAQVSKINCSAEFYSKPLLTKFLTYLVDKYLKGEGDKLKGYTIATEVFGKDEHFDPDQNALVRIYAGRLRRSLRIYYLEEGRNDPIYIKIPKGHYLPVIEKKRQKSSEQKSETDRIPDKVTTDNTILVLPFKNYSGDKEFDNMVTGHSQELSDALTRFSELKVISFNRGIDSSMSDEDVMEQIRNRGISFLVSGELLSFGKQVKINFRLISLADDSQIWSGNYKFDRNKDYLMDHLETITNHIVRHLGGEYGQINNYRYQRLIASNPASLSEQELLLKYYHTQTILGPDSLYEFQKLANEVLEENPDSALANSLVSSINSTIYTHDLPGAEEAYVRFGHLAEKAYSINSKHKIVLTNLASKCFYYNERERLIGLFEEAAKWIPMTPLGLGSFGVWLSLIDQWELGMKLIDEMFERNIYVPSWYHGITSLYYYRQFDYERSLEEANKFHFRDFYLGPAHRIAPLGQLGRISDAKREFENLLQIRPDFKSRGRYLLEIHLKEDTLLEHFLEGFEKIGVKID